jgi:hypothetical protein
VEPWPDDFTVTAKITFIEKDDEGRPWRIRLADQHGNEVEGDCADAGRVHEVTATLLRPMVNAESGRLRSELAATMGDHDQDDPS